MPLRPGVTISLEYEGAKLSEFGWPDLVEFVNRLAEALHAMPGGVSPFHALPVQLDTGSIGVGFRRDSALTKAVHRLRKGPTRRWTADEVRGLAPLKGYLRDKKASLSLVTPKGKLPFRLDGGAGTEDAACYNEAGFVEGDVMWTGGLEGVVVLRTDDGTVRLAAGPDLARRLGHHLYDRVEIAAEIERHIDTDAIIGATAAGDDFIVVQEAPGPDEALRAWAEVVGPDFVVDVETLLREQRAC